MPTGPSLALCGPRTPDQFHAAIGGLRSCKYQLTPAAPVALLGAAQVVGENVSWPFSRKQLAKWLRTTASSSNSQLLSIRPSHPRLPFFFNNTKSTPRNWLTLGLIFFSLCFFPIELFRVDFPTLPLLCLSTLVPGSSLEHKRRLELQPALHCTATCINLELSFAFYYSPTVTMPAKSRFTRLDAFTKTVEDARIRTTSGGIVTIVSLIVVLYLAWGEWADYRRTVIHPELIVDKGRGKQCPHRAVFAPW